MKKLIIAIIVIFLCSCSVSKPEIKEKTVRQRIHNPIAEEETTISEAYTDIIDKGKNRVNNILLACQKISGIKLSPGEEFSFNKLAGKRTTNNGYKSAPILVNGEKSHGIGGGICQVSTTIYMAALSGGFEITEHHNHSAPVAYASKGMDATVVYGVKDFKFVNSTNNSIYLYVWVEKNKIFAKIIKKSNSLS